MAKMKCFFFLLVAILLFSCSQDASYKKAEDPETAGTAFIRASLDGNYDKARFYLYNDSDDVNIRLLNKWKEDYDHLKSADKEGYKDASIRPIEIRAINDSLTSYSYYNSYKKDTITIKILKKDGGWLVNLKSLIEK